MEYYNVINIKVDDQGTHWTLSESGLEDPNAKIVAIDWNTKRRRIGGSGCYFTPNQILIYQNRQYPIILSNIDLYTNKYHAITEIQVITRHLIPPYKILISIITLISITVLAYSIFAS